MIPKSRVLKVRVVGFSAPEKQMLNSIFLLSVAPARQIGYKLWNNESGVAPDMYLLDGDSESAVASWQAAFSNTSDRTLVVGGKNTDLGVASAARPLGLKVVGAMDRLAIALNNVEKSREAAGHDVSEPRANRTLPTATLPTVSEPAPAPPAPVLNTSMNASLNSMGSISPNAATMSATNTGTLPTSMTATAPATTVLPSMTLQPSVSIDKVLEKSLAEKPVTEKVVEKILSEAPALEKSEVVEKPVVVEKTAAEKISATANLLASGVRPLSPAALSALVGTSSTRTNLRVVPSVSPLASSLPSATAKQSRLADPPAAQSPVARVADVPVLAPPPPVVHAPPAPAPPVIPLSAAPSPRHEEPVFRVLAVDDSPLMRTFLQNKLSPYGIQPEFAASGEEALFKISKQHYDLIFLDVMLPGMDGYDVCKMIKKNKDNNLMKVVMLTSKDKTFDKIRGTMAGCDGYLTKPVDEMKLRAIIERHTVTRK